ncbi:AAA domain-containing protein [Desulfitobacterium sp. Sab5]|uniref:AAA domain-containing protein n=1 Tax=Desulfitobacterium nosdiversum TaxID=3375356 RepID=UPI003CF624AB
MNTGKYLILNNGKDITADVKLCQYNSDTGRYDVTFKNGKTYPYGYQSIEWLKNPEILNPALVHITHDNRELFKIQDTLVFHAKVTDYWYIRFSDGSERSYDWRDIKIVASCLGESEAQNCMSYLRQQASINELKSKDGEILLQRQYEKLDFVGDDTAMAIYLNPKKHKVHTYHKSNFIFPFGGNASQFKAVENALNNQISVIQGPPGTGKTQTILNIIANLLVDGKTVQIVSNNNSATTNVLEKLSSLKYNMGFLVAPLGNSDNKKAFVQDQTGLYPDLPGRRMDTDKQSELREKIQSHVKELSDIFSKQERLAQVRLELDSILLEIKYFQQYCSETGFACSDIKPRRSLKSKRLMQLWQECNEFSEKERAVSFWYKIKSIFVYGISDWNFYKNNLSTIITFLQSMFYQARKSELSDEIVTLEKKLEAIDAKETMCEQTDLSMDYLRAKLFEWYGNKLKRVMFTEEDLWKNSGDVVKEYPIVLSTTFSSRSSLKDVIYDYLIMDEASQVDVTTGALALSCAKNAVIVGDLKQLPNVIKDDMRKRSDAVFNSYKLPKGYSFSENSFLKSVCGILPNAPPTLLREHYRCHPKIIGFCNQKFYNNELVVMTEEHGEPDTLEVFKTAVGDHQRDHINQRQVDVTIQEVFPMLKDVNMENVGIIAPYKDQVAAIVHQLDTDKIEVHTVHKFQGREKDTIVLNTVDDVATDFSDDPYLLNVAVSRAKKRLFLVVSSNEQPKDSNIGDLIAYIEYNNFQVVQSEIYSVFDLLYRQYTDARIAFLKKHPHVSAYDSENLMYGAIVDLLHSRPQLSLNVICHQPLNMLIRDPKRLNDEECRYAMNTATHIDFLIYNRISKKPILAIEVDGFHYHKPGTPQYEHDRMKDHILELYRIPLLRFATNGSGEMAKIRQALDEYEKRR